MLTVHQLSKSYGIQTILEDISFQVNAHERVGLIGPNGCGKSTLMRILVGDEVPDRGVVTFTPPDLRLGYLSQGFELDAGRTFGELLYEMKDGAGEAGTALERLAGALAVQPQDASLQAEYDARLTQMQIRMRRLQPEQVFRALDLQDITPQQLLGSLSGGQKTRLALAQVLLEDPQLLLLDEPTNHLDIEMLEWLEDWLGDFTGGVLIVSHDRTFLDRTVSRILSLSPETHKIKEYRGNYSAYLAQYSEEIEKNWQVYQDQQDEIRQLKKSIQHVRGLARFKKGGKADSGDKFARGFFANRSLEVMRRARALERRLDKLLNDEKIEKPRQSWQMKLDLGHPSHVSQDVVRLEGVTIGFPGRESLLLDLDLVIKGGQRIVLSGPNGCGKTTLLRVIAGEYLPDKGEIYRSPSLRCGYLTQEQECLDSDISPCEIIQKTAPFSQTEARSFLHYFLFSGDDPLRPVHTLSFGERSRLMLAVLVAQGCNFLLLDEPINYLDIPSRVRFEQALNQFEGTILAVIHDRYFIERFASDLWLVENRHIRKERLIDL